MKKRICPNCGFYLPIERGMLYCEDCREKLLKKYTEKQVEVPILGEIKDKKIIWYKGRKK